MRNSFLAIIFLGLTVYLGYVLYERSQKTDVAIEEEGSLPTGVLAGLSYPDEIKIVRMDGSSLDVSLLARDATQLQFKRLSDGQGFTFRIDQLDATTQARVLEYPNSGLLSAVELVERGKLTTEALYLEQLRVAIAKINGTLKDLEAKSVASNSQTERRTLKNRAYELLQERNVLEGKIAERE